MHTNPLILSLILLMGFVTYSYGDSQYRLSKSEFYYEDNLELLHTYKYSEDSLLIEERSYNEANELEKIYKHEYDQDKNRTRTTTFDVKTGLLGYTLMMYDDNKNKVYENTFTHKGKEEDSYSNVYDDKNRLIQSTYHHYPTNTVNYYKYEYPQPHKEICYSYDEDDTLLSYFVTEYDDEDRIIKNSEFTASDLILNYLAYEYNDKGLKTTEAFKTRRGLQYVIRFEYDQKGNLIKESTYDEGSTLESYSLYYYDPVPLLN
ncbi:hypothetical protein [Spirochaeta cellobiosiphila]|uniref:hypothetical protein n=1 Tax=Spirochaeta cellobiosiphila TaxID=504483 RepID=UPI0004292630|nr:hypothetical protein [Spirochaeta cellobiosiphila]